MLTIMSLFEILMLVCFGCAWPVSIWKSLRMTNVEGKSLPFLIIIFIGYVSGTLHKLLFAPDLVTGLYIFNGIMVAIDIALYFRCRLVYRNRPEDENSA